MKTPDAHRISLVFLLAALLGGCAAPARVERMQVDTSLAVRSAAAQSALKDSVAIKEVTGGEETNPAWMSKVSSRDFERALQASLRDAGMLSADRQAGAYILTARLQKLDQPFIGLDLKVTATVQYLLVERASGKEVYAKTVETPYTASFGDAFLGFERLKLANEGAMRANVSRLVDDLIALKLSALELR